MSTSPRLWTLVVTAALAMALLPTAATSDPPPDPPPPEMQDPGWGWGSPGGGGCQVQIRSFHYCESGAAFFMYCPPYYPWFLACV